MDHWPFFCFPCCWEFASTVSSRKVHFCGTNCTSVASRFNSHSFIFHLSHQEFTFLFQVSIVLLMFCPIYMYFFLHETVKPILKNDEEPNWLSKTVNVLNRRFRTMRDAIEIVIDKYFLYSSFHTCFSDVCKVPIQSIFYSKFLHFHC